MTIYRRKIIHEIKITTRSPFDAVLDQPVRSNSLLDQVIDNTERKPKPKKMVTIIYCAVCGRINCETEGPYGWVRPVEVTVPEDDPRLNGQSYWDEDDDD